MTAHIPMPRERVCAYNGDVACAQTERLIGFIAAEAREVSRRLASGRGAFPNWERTVYATLGERIRNATRPAIAPTRTISIIAGTSGGIEPLFALAYRRRRGLGGDPLVQVSSVLLRALDTRGIDAERVLGHVRAAGHLGGGACPTRSAVCPSPPPRFTEPDPRRSCHSGARGAARSLAARAPRAPPAPPVILWESQRGGPRLLGAAGDTSYSISTRASRRRGSPARVRRRRGRSWKRRRVARSRG